MIRNDRPTRFPFRTTGLTPPVHAVPSLSGAVPSLSGAVPSLSGAVLHRHDDPLGRIGPAQCSIVPGC
jgi:hypothetical protein